MGLALGVEFSPPTVKLVRLWMELGEPFRLLDAVALAIKAAHMLSRWAELDPRDWSRDVADYWGNLSDDEQIAIVERRKHGRRKNSAGVKGWISDQMRIKAAFARRDARDEPAVAGDAGVAGRRPWARLTARERKRIDTQFFDNHSDGADEDVARWYNQGNGTL